MQSRNRRQAMWAEALAMLDEAERLHRQFFRPGQTSETPSWEPPVDIYESGSEIWLYYALPGVAPEQLDISLAGDVLIVQGARHLPPPARRAAIRRLEIPYGRFERRVGLPTGRYELVQHELDKGCLVIGLRRVA